ncbi:MAG: tetratricopeptide repeat protein [Chthoniobacter sp.]|nr:tetratricopeptide repeat protein [Chthoniobacter sp.]
MILLHQAGRLAEAEMLYRQLLAVQPNHADALHMLAVVADQTGRSELAVELIRRTIALKPNDGAVYSNLGRVYRTMGRWEEAAAAYRHALQLRPDLPEPNNNLGNILRECGRNREAIEAFRRALELKPDNAEIGKNLGDALKDEGELSEAAAAYRQALRWRPDFPGAENNLGNTLRALGQIDEAIATFQRALRCAPENAGIHMNLGSALAEKGQMDDAMAAYRRALQLKVDFPEAHYCLGNAFKKLGNPGEAIAAYGAALQPRPGYPECCNNLGHVLREQGRLDEAAALFRRAIDLQPDYAEASSNLGNTLKDQGNMEGAMEAYRRAVRDKPEHPGIHSNLIYASLFLPTCDPVAMAAEEQSWNHKFGNPPQRLLAPDGHDGNPERRLRIGYLTPDFRDHVVGQNVMPLIREHDQRQFEIFCYSDVVKPDEMTVQFRRHPSHWRDVADVADETLAGIIREDRIDILVDLTQHMAGNRLPVFARRPAPVQVSFAGYPAATGVEAIGYRISDRYLEDGKSETENGKCERLMLVDSFWCYDPCGTEVAISALPARDSGHVTFGSLNNFCKVNETMLQLWARVLEAVKDSRLILLSHAGSHRQRTVDVLAREGIGAQRIEFVEPRPRREYLKLYQRLDIVLDPFPYNGHTTSLDALWMGVPVVSLTGQRAVSRAGLSQLTNLGLPELVAHSEDAYVAIAARLAGDLPRLAELRGTLRPRMEASVLMDAPRFARQIEDAYRAMWRQWCAQQVV